MTSATCDLRGQVKAAIWDLVETAVDAMVAVVAERERDLLRERIEALRAEWGLGTDPESADYGDPQVQQFGEQVLMLLGEES